MFYLFGQRGANNEILQNVVLLTDTKKTTLVFERICLTRVNEYFWSYHFTLVMLFGVLPIVPI